MEKEKDFKEDLPLSEAVFLILLSLAEGPKYGYAIMKDVHALSDQRVSLSTGTLYGALKRLLKQHWVVRVEGEPTVKNGRERKEYELTEIGVRVLDAEAARMRALASMAQFRSAESQ